MLLLGRAIHARPFCEKSASAHFKMSPLSRANWQTFFRVARGRLAGKGGLRTAARRHGPKNYIRCAPDALVRYGYSCCPRRALQSVRVLILRLGIVCHSLGRPATRKVDALRHRMLSSQPSTSPFSIVSISKLCSARILSISACAVCCALKTGVKYHFVGDLSPQPREPFDPSDPNDHTDS